MKQDIQNNINSLEETPEIIYLQREAADDSFVEDTWCEDEINDTDVKYIRADIATTHEQQAYEKAKMELEVEIGLQKFGQLMKEKEAIIQQARRNAVEEFAEWHNDIPDYAIEAVCKVDKEDIEKFLKRKIST